MRSASSGSTRRPVKISSFARGQADAARQEIQAAAVRDEAAVDVAHRERRGGGGDDEVAAQRDVAPEPGRRSVHRGDRRLRERMQRGDGVVRALLPAPSVEGQGSGRLGHALHHALHVAAGAEAAPAARDHERTDRCVPPGGIQCRSQLAPHRVVDGVALLRTMQRQRGHATLDVETYGFKTHGHPHLRSLHFERAACFRSGTLFACGMPAGNQLFGGVCPT